MIAVVVAVNWPLFGVLATGVPGNLGDPILNAWILGWLSTAVSKDLSLWDAPIFHPHDDTLAYSEPLLGVGLFAVPLNWLVEDHIVTYNLVMLVLPLLTFFGTAMLVREVTGRLDAGVMLGILVATSPYLAVSQITRLQMQTCGWSFLALASLHRVLATGSAKASAALYMTVVLQALSNTYLWAYLVIPMGIVLLHAAMTSPPVRSRSRMVPLALALGAAAVALAPVARILASVKAEFGVSRIADEVDRYSADLRSYLSVWHEQAPTWLWPEATADRALFLGAPLMLLGVAGAIILACQRSSRWRHPAVAYIVVAGVALALSLGPTPSAGGTPLGVAGPYALLAGLVPGFDALRAPSRFATYVLLALGVLAGVAIAPWCRRATPRSRTLAIVACGLIGVAQGWRTFDWVAILPPSSDGDRRAYSWLRAQPPAAMIEWPFVADFQAMPRAAGGSQSLVYQFAALSHGHRLVNGSSAFSPPFVEFLEGDASPLKSVNEAEAVVRLLRHLDVRYVVVHLDHYTADALEFARQRISSMAALHADVEEHVAFGQTHVLALRPQETAHPWEEAHLQKVPPTALTFDGTSRSAMARLNDDDLAHRWTTSQHAGNRLRITLDRERHAAGVTLHLRPHSVADYPRQLQVTGIAVDGTEASLYSGHGLVELGRQLVRFPQDPAVPLRWSPRQVVALEIEIMRDVPTWQWSVHEVDVWEAADPETATRAALPAMSSVGRGHALVLE